MCLTPPRGTRPAPDTYDGNAGSGGRHAARSASSAAAAAAATVAQRPRRSSTSRCSSGGRLRRPVASRLSRQGRSWATTSTEHNTTQQNTGGELNGGTAEKFGGHTHRPEPAQIGRHVETSSSARDLALFKVGARTHRSVSSLPLTRDWVLFAALQVRRFVSSIVQGWVQCYSLP